MLIYWAVVIEMICWASQEVSIPTWPQDRERCMSPSFLSKPSSIQHWRQALDRSFLKNPSATQTWLGALSLRQKPVGGLYKELFALDGVCAIMRSQFNTQIESKIFNLNDFDANTCTLNVNTLQFTSPFLRGQEAIDKVLHTNRDWLVLPKKFHQ